MVKHLAIEFGARFAEIRDEDRQWRKPLIYEQFPQNIDRIRTAAKQLSASVKINDVELLRDNGKELLEIAVVNL